MKKKINDAQIDADLKEYNEEELKLMYDITFNKLTCIEAQERCKLLWKLIPSYILLNPVKLNRTMEKYYADSPDWNYSQVHTIINC